MSIKQKIDKSAELPEARAALSGLTATIARIGLLKPSEIQGLQIVSIKEEVEALISALK